MSKQAFDKKLQEIESLRADPASALAPLRKALKDRNNFVVSKAAAMAAHLRLEDLKPDLLAAFDRFFVQPVKTDPQCWAKTAIAKALKDLDHQEADVFVRGLAHIQLEPVWGGSADSAAVLRGTCALALVNCNLGDLETLGHLVAGLADPEKSVRADTALAIAQLARPEGALLMRLKVLLGDPEPEVLGQCFHALLSLGEPVSFLGRFLQSADDDVRLEAAGALAQSREPEAMQMLRTFWDSLLSPELRNALVFALGASPQPESAEFLLSILAGARQDLAASTIKSLAASRFRDEVREKVRTAVNEKCDPNLQRVFTQEFS